MVLAGHPDMLPQPARTSLVSCLVTQVDGMGRGSIGISVSQGNERRTAAFLCDVRSGFCDALGEVEPESVAAGGLLDELAEQAESDCARDVPELALGLLAGSLTVSRELTFLPQVRELARPHARAGLSSLGCSRRRSPASTHPRFPPPRWPARVRDLFEECPSWLDLSPLTFQLAEEIRLREGSPEETPAAMPAFTDFCLSTGSSIGLNFTGECSCGWRGSGKVRDLTDLATSAVRIGIGALGQTICPIPSHPFAVELTTRSLVAAESISKWCRPGRAT